jgi:outer membrane protein OmpA-like peptidoglycan-associated protein
MFQLFEAAPWADAAFKFLLGLLLEQVKPRRAPMSISFANLKATVAGSTVVLVMSMGLAVAGEQPSSRDILNSLTPKPLTRSLSGTAGLNAKKADEDRFLATVRNRTTRSLSTGEREKIAAVAEDKPKIDLEINFDFNSDDISKSALPTVAALAAALNDSKIKGSTFMVGGYTDAKGAEEYNQGLSERRADAVKQMLVTKYGIPADTLVSVGYGKSHLKNPANPMAAENRRVGIVNMADRKVAGN